MFRRFPWILRSSTSSSSSSSSLTYQVIAKQVSDRFFDAQKQEIAANLNENKNDKSLAGKVDERILDMVNLINSKKDYFTTSSCSGRISLFHRDSPASNIAVTSTSSESEEASNSNPNKKRGSGLGTIFQSHDPLPLDCEKALEDCWNALHLQNEENIFSSSLRGTVELKFEPLILHVRCRDLDSSQMLLDAAAASGLRKSGLIAPSVKLPMKSDERDLLKVLSLASASPPPNESYENENNNNNKMKMEQHDKKIPNYIFGNSFLVSIGSMSGVNNIVCLQGEVMIEKAKFHTLLKYFNESLLMGENEKRKKLLFENINKL